MDFSYALQQIAKITESLTNGKNICEHLLENWPSSLLIMIVEILKLLIKVTSLCSNFVLN